MSIRRRKGRWITDDDEARLLAWYILDTLRSRDPVDARFTLQTSSRTSMILGFHYHVTLRSENKRLYLPGYMAVFIDSLAEEVDQLILFLHEADGADAEAADRQLYASNITWVNLGKKTPTWHRSLLHRSILANTRSHTDLLDAIIVRSPTPLAPYFYKYIDRSKIVFLIIGDYAEGALHFKVHSLRDIAIRMYLLHNHWLFEKQISDARVLVNSHKLYKKYEPRSKDIQMVVTTTIRDSDFYQREDTCTNSPINLLYTGRIDPAKGLFELLHSLFLLRQSGCETLLHLVGWEYGGGTNIIEQLGARARELNIAPYVIFHGKKALGEELNQMYRMADIYVIPTYFEGFPKTIWEAMANGLPVIASNVGGIPYYLNDKENVLLVEPRSSEQIVTAVKAIVDDRTLRRRLIANALIKAREVTIGRQTKRMVDVIESCVGVR